MQYNQKNKAQLFALLSIPKEVTKARAVLAYVWVRYLGRSGHELGRALGVSPQSLYAASVRIEEAGAITTAELKSWCR